MVAAKATLKLCIVGRLSVHVMPLENWLIDVIYVIRFQKQFSRDGPIKRLFHLRKRVLIQIWEKAMIENEIVVFENDTFIYWSRKLAILIKMPQNLPSYFVGF